MLAQFVQRPSSKRFQRKPLKDHKSLMRWWSFNIVSYQCLADNALAIPGARRPPWRWDLIGQMWSAALVESNWLNPKQLLLQPWSTLYFTSSPTRPHFSLYKLSSRSADMKDLAEHQSLTYITTQMYNTSSQIFVLVSLNYLSISMHPSLLVLQFQDYNSYCALMTSAWADNFRLSWGTDVDQIGSNTDCSPRTVTFVGLATKTQWLHIFQHTSSTETHNLQ